MARIGFIGLGHMGLPMAINLIKANHFVTGFDLQEQALKSFAAAGGQIAVKLEEAVVNQDIFITMLQTGAQVSQVCLSSEGLFNRAEKNILYIDCSSIDVKSSRHLHEQAKVRELFMVDAPVSGGVAGAEAATLTFMVGGEEKAFEQAKPILSAMGKKIIHTGLAGSGQAAKICNNMILGISMIAVSEAFVLAEHLGLSAEKLFEVVSNSSGQCWSMSQYVPVPGILPNVPANRNYQAGFTAAMMLKDLNLSQSSAEAVGLTTPLGAQATALYQQFNEQEQSNLDFSAIIKMLKRVHKDE
ncbi:MAG: 3-hydroxyisobutyrate dehydrogenase [Tatlockia sp.]|nr:3-hydroxyisobutyrate dehydrogenase [Tatlockia sp.]